MDVLIDLTGKIFGRWTVIERVNNGKVRHVKWLCKCECGEVKQVLGYALRQNKSLSCGCYKSDVTRNRMKKHGKAATHSRTLEYKAWAQMKTRCTNLKAKQYEDYGGRGISVCERWMNSFEYFLEDMGLKPSSAHSLDRKDVNGNYEPSNCKWSTIFEQSHNRRRASNNTSGHSGVKWHQRLNKWEVSIASNNKRMYLGVYDDIEMAIKIRKDAEIKYWGMKSS